MQNIIELDEKGENYRILWGLVNGGRPTSELPSHLMNHEVKKGVTNVYHAHTTNVIALTFVLPLEDKVFTRELWEMATECPVVFPSGIGVVGWMVPGGREIAVATSALMKEYDVAIWAHHGMFCSGDDDDKIRLNQRKPSKYKGLSRFGPEKNLQRINKFMKERPIFYKNLIQMKENFRFYLRCFYCITKVVILQFNSENRTELARNG